MTAARKRNPGNYELKLAFSFGFVVLGLVLLAIGATVFLFQRTQREEENRLCGALAAIVSESISRVSFSGKHHARQLIQEMLSRSPELAYIAVVTLEGEMLAHSDPARNDQAESAEDVLRTLQTMERGGQILAEGRWEGRAVKEAVVPYRGGYDNQIMGVVRVGMLVDRSREEQRENLTKLLALVAGITLVAFALVSLLSRVFGRATSSLARQLQGILDNAPVAIAICDSQGRLLAASAAFESLTGAVSGPPVQGRALAELLPAEAGHQLSRPGPGGAPSPHVDCEVRFAREGQEHYWHFTRFPIALFPSGEAGQSCVFINDVTPSRAAEVRLRELLQRLHDITATVPVVLYELVAVTDENTLRNRFSYVSEKIGPLLGLTAEEMVADPAAFAARVHPDDIEALVLASRRAIHSEGEFCQEFRVVLGDGEERWLRACSMPSGERTWSGYLMDITTAKLSEMALAKSEEKYRAIFDNAPIGIFRTTFAGRFLEANRTLARMIGYETPAELMASIRDVGADLYYEPTFKAKLRDALLESPARASVEVEFKRRDGSRFHAFINARLELDGEGRPEILEGTIEDINDRKRAEELLRQSEEKFSRLFLLSPDSIILVEADSEVLAEVNDTFVRAMGYTREEALGRTTRELGLYANETDLEAVRALVEEKGHVESYEFEARHKDGSVAVCSMSCQLIVIDGKRYRLSIVRDITSIKHMQAMMVQTEKMISVGGIAAGIAHEINNPLGIVLQASQNLMQRIRPDFRKNVEAAERIGLNMELLVRYMRERKLDTFVQDIQSAAVRASGIIRHMLDFSRKSESQRTACHLPEIIDKAVELARSDYDLKKSYDFKRIHIAREYEEGLPTISCTETEIEQVLLNLLRNAAQALATALPPVENPAIFISAKRMDEHVRISVRDNGPGVAPEVRRRIFEPFFTTKAPGVGTGLGLSVSYFIVTKGHGGGMHVESQPGEGATFIVDLPVP